MKGHCDYDTGPMLSSIDFRCGGSFNSSLGSVTAPTACNDVHPDWARYLCDCVPNISPATPIQRWARSYFEEFAEYSSTRSKATQEP
jgi:hypothetical protein